MSAVRIKKGDTVKVIAGKDKGKTGKDGKKVRVAKATGEVID